MAKTGKTIGCLTALLILLALLGFGYFKFLWVFSDGTKTGELNSLTYTDSHRLRQQKRTGNRPVQDFQVLRGR